MDGGACGRFGMEVVRYIYSSGVRLKPEMSPQIYQWTGNVRRKMGNVYLLNSDRQQFLVHSFVFENT